jgi:hypothetical protein
MPVDGDFVALAMGGPSALVFGQVAGRAVPDIHRNSRIFAASTDRHRSVAKARHFRGLHGKIQDKRGKTREPCQLILQSVLTSTPYSDNP